MSVRQIVSKVIKSILPYRIYKLIANGAIIVPAYYKTIIDDAEKSFDLSLEDSDEKVLLLMRKYAHIIDKGLHRKDAAPGHSKKYYTLLSQAIERLRHTKYSDDPTVHWAIGKLEKYQQLQKGGKFLPLCGRKEGFIISFESFETLAKSRRSNRDFSEIEISESIINKLRNIANWAPSSCNKQPIEIYVTNNPCLASKCLKCCRGGTGFSANIPSFWVFTSDILGYVWPSEIYLPIVDVCLGVQNVLLGATTFGLSTTILSWAQKSEEEEKELRKLLNIPPHHQIILCGVMGYANRDFQTPERKLS